MTSMAFKIQAASLVARYFFYKFNKYRPNNVQVIQPARFLASRLIQLYHPVSSKILFESRSREPRPTFASSTHDHVSPEALHLYHLFEPFPNSFYYFRFPIIHICLRSSRLGFLTIISVFHFSSTLPSRSVLVSIRGMGTGARLGFIADERISSFKNKLLLAVISLPRMPSCLSTLTRYGAAFTTSDASSVHSLG
jgi:hypothetical protein